MSTKHEVAVELAGGKRMAIETGRMAKQASGAALVTTGETVVLATAVASPDPREGIDFFPLTVDYREYTYAGGRIPGGFIKREGRPSEKEILTARQIDRPIRPLFPDGFRNETQVIALVFSADKENDPDVMAINAAAAAVALSDIPFGATVGAVRVGRVDGEFVVNPTYAERAGTTVNIMVVGHKDGIVMIESGAKEETEEVILAAIEFAHAEIRKIVAAIDELVAKAGKPKRAIHGAGVRRSLLRRTQSQDRRAAEGCAGHQDLTARRRATRWSSRSRTSSRLNCPPTIPTPRRSWRIITSICASACSASR